MWNGTTDESKDLKEESKKKSICAHASIHIQYTYCSVYTVYTIALERISNVYSIRICLQCLYGFYFYLFCVYVSACSACLYICVYACHSACKEVRRQRTSDQEVQGHSSTSTMPILHLRFSNTMKRGREIRVREIGHLFMRQYILDMSGTLNLKNFNHNFP